MPTFTKYLLAVLFAVLVISPATSSVSANSDPKSATVSATATVPTTTPTTSDTTTPSNPALISPYDGTITADRTPLFVWRRSSDNNSNTLTYTLYHNGVATYLGISNIGNSASSNYSAIVDGNEIKLTPTIDLPDNSYNWTVTASDGSGNTSHSTTWNFRVDSTPPFIKINEIDNYSNLNLHSTSPENFTDLNFDITGPTTVSFHILTEPYSTLTLQFYDLAGNLVTQSSWSAGNSGELYPSHYLPVGLYKLVISAYDLALNTTALPEFQLTITQATISISPPTLPGSTPSSPLISIPYTPLSLDSLPATVAQIETRLPLLYIIGSLLAVIALLMLVLLWKKKYNLVLSDENGQPLAQAVIYHSIPNTARSQSSILLTTKQPISYNLEPKNLGKIYLKGLTRYSTLTIRTNQGTLILSLSRKQPVYFLTI